jgi:hypothetical protein
VSEPELPVPDEPELPGFGVVSVPELLLPLCARAWLARKTIPAAARPKPHPIFFIISPYLFGFSETGARRRLSLDPYGNDAIQEGQWRRGEWPAWRPPAMRAAPPL